MRCKLGCVCKVIFLVFQFCFPFGQFCFFFLFGSTIGVMHFGGRIVENYSFSEEQKNCWFSGIIFSFFSPHLRSESDIR